MKKTTLWKDTSIPLKVVSCLATILLFACSSGFPSESDGKQFLENYSKTDGTYKVKSFTKTNGVEEGTNYSLEFEAQVECLKVRRSWQPGDILPNPSTPFYAYVGCEKVGEVMTFKGNLKFNKTEKGWRGPDGKIY